MAKRICPFCKEKVKANATICKHCRSDLPALPPKKWYQTWKGFFLIMFILAIFVQAFEEKPKTTSTTSQSSSVQSSPSPNKRLVVNANYANIDEKKILQDSYFGNFSNAKIKNKSDNTKLVVWQPWIQYVKQKFSPQIQKTLLNGAQKLSIAFDEIWIIEKDEYLTESEKKKYKGQLDIIKLYWKQGKIQASTVEKLYKANPLTGVNLPSPAHKITDIFDRTYILKHVSEN